MKFFLSISPSFQHDCEVCKYLGTLRSNGEVMDCYVHEAIPGPTGRTGTIIARHSSDGSDYDSRSLDLCESLPERDSAIDRAFALYRATR